MSETKMDSTAAVGRKLDMAEELSAVTIRFAGDSGDGVQLTGMQFTTSTALAGNDLSTLPDYPAEIRAPAGTMYGVSGYQIQFGSREVLTPGDAPDVLVAMNPAALKVNIADIKKGGILLINSDAFTPQNLKKVQYAKNPLEDGSLSDFRVITVELTRLTGNALAGLSMTKVQIDRCKNFFALGMLYWLYDRPMDGTLKWIEGKFKKNPLLVTANQKALHAGNAFAETAEIFNNHYKVKKATMAPGKYRNMTGNEATALGMIAASQLSGLELWYGSYPITPASDILHELAKHKNFGVRTFQAEDEISAIGSALGAAFAGKLGATGTSGPGVALKSEVIGLAVMVELPLVVLNIQRGGPSTGLPTKTEQADLLQCLYGRNGECPVPIFAPATPSECFTMILEAFRVAITYMTPVFFLSDGYLGSGSEPWLVPDFSKLPKIKVPSLPSKEEFKPYQRTETHLSRPWAVPGTPGYEHRIGGLEKQDVTGNVNYEPENHEKMVRLRAAKVEKIAQDIPPLEILGPKKGKVLVVGWGSTYGAITMAVKNLSAQGKSVSSIHLRHLNPLPPDLGEILGQYDNILIPEMNLGQLLKVIRAKYLVAAVGLHKIQGQPFKIAEIEAGIAAILNGGRN